MCLVELESALGALKERGLLELVGVVELIVGETDDNDDEEEVVTTLRGDLKAE